MGEIYGNPALLIEDDTTDRVGLRTLILSLLWTPDGDNLTVSDLDAQEPAVPAVPGGVIFIGRQRIRDKGALRTYWTFEGITGNGKDVTFKGRGQSLDYGFQGGFQAIGILKNPKFSSLQTTYQGQVTADAQVFWPNTLSPTAQNGPIKADPSQTQKTNPMFGADSYLVLDGTYTYRYLAFALGGPAFDLAGTAVPTAFLPGVPPAPGNNRNWLVYPPETRRAGPVFEIIERYWLSEDGGWRQPLYGPNAGNGSGNNGGQIQSSGPIQGATGL